MRKVYMDAYRVDAYGVDAYGLQIDVARILAAAMGVVTSACISRGFSQCVFPSDDSY